MVKIIKRSAWALTFWLGVIFFMGSAFGWVGNDAIDAIIDPQIEGAE